MQGMLKCSNVHQPPPKPHLVGMEGSFFQPKSTPTKQGRGGHWQELTTPSSMQCDKCFPHSIFAKRHMSLFIYSHMLRLPSRMSIFFSTTFSFMPTNNYRVNNNHIFVLKLFLWYKQEVLVSLIVMAMAPPSSIIITYATIIFTSNHHICKHISKTI